MLFLHTAELSSPCWIAAEWKRKSTLELNPAHLPCFFKLCHCGWAPWFLSNSGGFSGSLFSPTYLGLFPQQRRYVSLVRGQPGCVFRCRSVWFFFLFVCFIRGVATGATMSPWQVQQCTELSWNLGQFNLSLLRFKIINTHMLKDDHNQLSY